MNRITTLLVALTLFSAASGIAASEIQLRNGDRISGTIIQKGGESITIKTPYAGEIKVEWKHVVALHSDTSLKIVLADGTSIHGTALESKPGHLRIKSGEILESAPLPLEKIVAINPPATDPQAVKFSGRANTGLSVVEGNSSTRKYHINVEAVARTRSNRFTVGAVLNNAENEGVESEDNFTGYGKYDHFFSSKWYGFSNVIFTRDQYKDLSLKTAIGLGAGYQIWEAPERNLSIELGLNYVNEDYIVAQDNQYPAGRWALTYDTFLFGDAVQLFHNHSLLMGLKQTDDISALAQTGFRFPLIDKLSATIQFNWDWDNTPAPGKKRVDTGYLTTIDYTW